MTFNNRIRKGTELRKLLFIPQNSWGISQMIGLRDELSSVGMHTTSIALNKRLARQLRQSNFQYTNVEDYHTLNAVKILQHEDSDLVFLNPISISPFTTAFSSAAAHLGIPCLQMYSGDTVSDTRRGFSSLSGKASGASKFELFLFSSINNVLSFAYMAVTIAATKSYVDAHNTLFKELMKLFRPYAGSRQYREGASLIVPDHRTKETMVALRWPEESVFVLEQSKLDKIIPQVLHEG